METKQHGHLILQYFRQLNMNVGGSVRLDTIVDYGIDLGIGLDEMENSLIHASSMGWVMSANGNVHLTESGFRLINPANDNLAEPDLN